MNTNPYSAPSSSVDTPSDPGNFELHDPRTVSVGHGAKWFGDGMGHFTKNPGVWILITIAYLFIASIPSIVSQVAPGFGVLLTFVSILFTFVWVGGLMMACRAQDSGEGISVTQLFAGFKHRLGPLMLLSIIFMLLMVVVVVIISVAMAGQLMTLGILNAEQFDPSMLVDNITVILLPVLVMLLFLIPIMMLVWFAPALIVLNNVPLMSAIGLSFKGCFKNMLPFLIYGLVFLVVGIAAIAVIMLAAFLVGFGALILYVIFVFIFLPVVQGSIYRSYKDIFIEV